MISKPPKPGSLVAMMSIPPPASCSPLSGKSSSNTCTLSFPGGYGLASVSTVTGFQVLVAVFQVTGAPPMLWPQVGDPAAIQAAGLPVYPAANGLAPSPGRIER